MQQGDAKDTEARLARALDSQQDPLALGGQLYLRMATALTEGSSPLDAPLSQSAQLYLYADARPTEHLRAYVKARVDHLMTNASNISIPGPLG